MNSCERNVKWRVVRVMSRDSPYKDDNVGFTTVLFKPETIKWKICFFLGLKLFNSDNYSMASAVEMCNSLL